MNRKERADLGSACKSGDAEKVKHVCQKNPDAASERFSIDFPRRDASLVTINRLTPLHFASYYGNANCCVVLLDAGADVDARDALGRTPLMYARHGTVVELLLSRGANQNATDKSENTCVHHCIHNINSLDGDCVEKLISAGADVIAWNARRRTPLCLLIELYSSEESVVRALEVGMQLIRAGANVNTSDRSGTTFLHLCSGKSRGDDAVGQQIEALKRAGADLDAQDKYGNTPLHIAAMHNNKIACSKLVELRAWATAINHDGQTPLIVASENHCTDTFWALMDKSVGTGKLKSERGTKIDTVSDSASYQDVGALAARKSLQPRAHEIETPVPDLVGDVNARRPHAVPPMLGCLLFAAKHGHTQDVVTLVRLGAKVNACMEDGQTALHLAVMHERTEMVDQLLRLRADPNVSNTSGYSALELAVMKKHAKMVGQLLAPHVKWYARYRRAGCNGIALLSSATEVNPELVSLRIALGEDANARDAEGNTALHRSAINGLAETAAQLVVIGVDKKARNANGQTALHLAVIEGHPEVVLRLILLGENPAQVDTAGRTALHLAVIKAHADIVQQLITFNARVDAQDRAGHTALHLAVTNGHTEMVSLLLARRAKVHTQDQSGHTALHLAVINGHTEMVSLLLARGAKISTQDKKWPHCTWPSANAVARRDRKSTPFANSGQL